MEIQEDQQVISSIVKKGKRTKRPRAEKSVAQSTQNSPMDESASPSGSACCLTEEDEDLANCLILLSQSRPDSSSSLNPTTYECKTCNKSFPSFQALGGHRASHKKLKLSPPDHQDPQQQTNNPNFTTDTSLNMGGSVISLPSPVVIGIGATVGTTSGANKVNKIHECSICGAEFNSGQALGGHMRRHRPLVVAPLPVENLSQEVEKKDKSLLELDLNLPAPFEEEDQSGEFVNGGANGGNGDNHEGFQFEMDSNSAPVGQPQLFRSSLIDCRF